MIGLDQAAVRRHLVALGVPREKANRVAAGDVPSAAPRIAPAPIGPVTLVLPWSCLASDNQRHTKLAAHSTAYKLARTRAHAEASEQWGPRAPFAGRIALSIVFTPPRLGRPDPTNLLKALLDALGATRDEPGVCYHDDGQIDILHVERAAPNVDRPRAEITIEEIAP